MATSASFWGLWVGVGIGIAAALPAGSQTVERHTPLVTPVAVATAKTGLPVGPALIAVVIVGDNDGIADVTRPFMGQPISPALIRRLEGAIDRKLAETGRPGVVRFVSAPDVPPGTMTFQRLAPRAGAITVTGASAAEGQSITARLGVEPGAAIDDADLAIALDSLNRYPFRQVAAAFSAGAEPDSRDIALTVTGARFWQANAGVKYATSPAQTWRRVFVGGSIGGLVGRDSVLAFQATASPSGVTHDARHPQYTDGDLTYGVPVSRDGVIEAGVDVTAQLFHYPPDDYWLIEVDGTLDYRHYLYDAAGKNAGDVRVGVEARHERVRTITGGAQVGDDSEEMYELYAGLHRVMDTASRHDEGDLSFHLSPVTIDPGSSDAHFAAYSDGRMRSAHYSYVDLTLDHAAALTPALGWHAQVSAQLASGPMPYYVQGVLGGVNNVRGYFLYDGSADDVVIVRNELGLRPKGGGLAPDLFAFFDAGTGYDAQLRTSRTLVSVGLGASLPVTASAVINLDIDHALTRGAITPAGTTAVETSLTYKY